MHREISAPFCVARGWSECGPRRQPNARTTPEVRGLNLASPDTPFPIHPENLDRLQNRPRDNITGVKFAYWQNVDGHKNRQRRELGRRDNCHLLRYCEIFDFW
jgi:hypothetical protein